MGLLKKRSVLLVTLLAAILASGSADDRPPAPVPGLPGERLTYEVTWAAFEAGDVTSTVRAIGPENANAYEVDTTAQSHGFVSLLYNLNDEFRSRFTPGNVCSQGISKHVSEGRRRKQTDIVFDATRHLEIFDEHNLAVPGEPPKHLEQPIPACVEDVVSAFYFLRHQPMKVGDKINVPVNDGAKTVDVTVEIQARESIDTPLGRRDALRAEPTVFGSLYKRKGRMLIWFSDDERHLPLRIKAVIAVGAITGTLKSVGNAPAESTIGPSPAPPAPK